jgi:hypothetical protein
MVMGRKATIRAALAAVWISLFIGVYWYYCASFSPSALSMPVEGAVVRVDDYRLLTRSSDHRVTVTYRVDGDPKVAVLLTPFLYAPAPEVGDKVAVYRVRGDRSVVAIESGYLSGGWRVLVPKYGAAVGLAALWVILVQYWTYRLNRPVTS